MARWIIQRPQEHSHPAEGRVAGHKLKSPQRIINVLTKLRSGETLTPKEKTIHEQGLVSVLKQLHDDLDKAVRDELHVGIMKLSKMVIKVNYVFPGIKYHRVIGKTA